MASAPATNAGRVCEPTPLAAVEHAVRRVAGERGRLVLAVSGGRDSMVMLHAFSAVARESIAAVATFDHGTGESAARARRLVERTGAALGLHVDVGEAAVPLAGEAALREARWEFLRDRAAAHAARVATAHTRDDQVETIVIRMLRGSGARGLAALHAAGPVVRPLLDVRRADVAAYAAATGVRWVEDSSNASPLYLRNRIRRDLMPALERADPALGDLLLSLSRDAAELRSELDDLVSRAVQPCMAPGSVQVARAHLACYDASSLALLWPAIAARAGVILDRRGTSRLAQFTMEGRAGGRMQLSGGAEVVLHRGVLNLRRAGAAPEIATRLLRGTLCSGQWRFERRDDGGERGLWEAHLPADRELRVRAWHPGDRMTPAGAHGPRRVKGLLRDAGIEASARRTWPVVLAQQEIVWVPGVRRSVAATARSGRPVARYVCERATG